MSMIIGRNKRLAKNTLLLYFRMLFLMGVSLYTSRVVLNALGVENYGIYNVVGGVVAMFSILSSSLSAAISRFITFELGKENQDRLVKVFSSAITIQIVLMLIVIVLAEVVGVWFLNAKMNIPIDRMYTANWVFQFSILTFSINLISIPYNAAIIAHEKMSVFAYISILEAAGKLLMAWLITISPIDKLFSYSVLMCLVAVFIRLIYGWYCKFHFAECSYHFVFDKKLLKEMFGFAGWNFIGASSFMLKDQGINVLLNIFFGAIVNAARSIAFQVNIAVNSFAQNFMMALNPQIVKSYASGDLNYVYTLMKQGARFSYFMLLVLSLPIMVRTHYILQIWLNIVPDHTVNFVRIVLMTSLIDSLSLPLQTVAQATGKIKRYQITVGGLTLFCFPLAYIGLELYGYPEIALWVVLLVSVLTFIARLVVLKRLIKLNIRTYLKSVFVNVLIVSVIALLFTYYINLLIDDDFRGMLLVSMSSIMTTLFVIYFVGCNHVERKIINSKIMKYLKNG